MADKKNSDALAYVLLGLGAAALGYAAYKMFVPTTTNTNNTGNNQNTYVPPGGTLTNNGLTYTNTGNNPVWVDAFGVISTGTGTILGSIADIIAATSGGSGTTTTPQAKIANWYQGGLM